MTKAKVRIPSGKTRERFTSAKPRIRRLRPDEAKLCARIMAASEPWLTLGRKQRSALALFQDPDREVYAAEINSRLAGFIVLCMTGALVGYIQTICVAPEFRNRQVGTALLRSAEKRIFRHSPNVFLLVSSFNTGAQRLYARLGYEMIGSLRDYVVVGHSEFLMRKTIGPMEGFIRG